MHLRLALCFLAAVIGATRPNTRKRGRAVEAAAPSARRIRDWGGDAPVATATTTDAPTTHAAELWTTRVRDSVEDLEWRILNRLEMLRTPPGGWLGRYNPRGAIFNVRFAVTDVADETALIASKGYASSLADKVRASPDYKALQDAVWIAERRDPFDPTNGGIVQYQIGIMLIQALDFINTRVLGLPSALEGWEDAIARFGYQSDASKRPEVAGFIDLMVVSRTTAPATTPAETSPSSVTASTAMPSSTVAPPKAPRVIHGPVFGVVRTWRVGR